MNGEKGAIADNSSAFMLDESQWEKKTASAQASFEEIGKIEAQRRTYEGIKEKPQVICATIDVI